MCRLFGFRSSSSSTVHGALVEERNSLRRQSLENPDGWGIANYGEEPLPQVARGLGAAHLDPDFERVSSRLSARTVVAHVRLASVGSVTADNAHPFLFGRWAFAHNGTLRDFAVHRSALEAAIAPQFLARVRGTTDSERCFALFLSRLFDGHDASERPAVERVARALASTLDTVARITDGAPGELRSAMNFLVSDGDVLVATRRLRSLFVSAEMATDRPRPTRRPSPGDRLSTFQVASEQLAGEDAWFEVPEESVVGVDRNLTYFEATVPALLGASGGMSALRAS